MKTILVIRHSHWDGQTDTLSLEGIADCEAKKTTLGSFTTVIASPFNRTVEAARLLSGNDPVVDDRASMLALTPEEAAWLKEARKNSPLGVAGVIFGRPDFLEPVKVAGEKCLSLIEETLEKLPLDGRALIVSHDGTMVAVEKLLKNEPFSGPLDHTYGNLEGFEVDANLKFTKLAFT
ncbi:MAG: histidine phosphatase family protein [bacterium]